MKTNWRETSKDPFLINVYLYLSQVKEKIGSTRPKKQVYDELFYVYFNLSNEQHWATKLKSLKNLELSFLQIIKIKLVFIN